MFDVKMDFTYRAPWILDGHKIIHLRVLHMLVLCLERVQEHHFYVLHLMKLNYLHLKLEMCIFKY